MPRVFASAYRAGEAGSDWSEGKRGPIANMRLGLEPFHYLSASLVADMPPSPLQHSVPKPESAFVSV